jgi:hypothetical protein
MQSIPAVLDHAFYKNHGELLYTTYNKITGKHLVEANTSVDSRIIDLYKAQFAIVSHGIEDDPVFNFGNKVALELFALSWPEFIALPSRHSAEAMEREERKKLLNEVSQNGFIDDYSGIRIASTGKRFLINQALVWNLMNDQGCYCGQAAMFKQWTHL